MAIITISRGTFAGGQKLAESVARRLDYCCLSREEVLTNAAIRFDVTKDKLCAALDNKPSFLEGIHLGRIHYVSYVRAALCRAVKDDNVVYHGQVGHLLLTGIPHVLAVEVIADMEFRANAAMARYGFNRHEAVDFIKKVDKDRTRWTRYIYQVDWRDPLMYEMIVNLDRLDINAASEIIAGIVSLPRLQTTLASQKRMNDIVLSTEVRARIAQYGDVNDRHIKVGADNGVITLSGKVDTIYELDRIKTIARRITGVQEIRSNILLRAPEAVAGLAREPYQ